MPNVSPQFIESLYLQYQKNPSSVEAGWQQFFEGYELGTQRLDGGHVVDSKETALQNLILAYRTHGHLLADVNPLAKHAHIEPSALSVETAGFEQKDQKNAQNAFGNQKVLGLQSPTLSDIENRLKEIYCGKVGYQFVHCNNKNLRDWIVAEIEQEKKDFFSASQKKDLLTMSAKACLFEDFLQTKYVGVKRFGLEGAESLVPGLDMMLHTGAQNGVKEFVFGMAHRGRLNVLVNILQKPYDDLFTEFEGGQLPQKIVGDGDVKYHLGYSSDIQIKGKKVHLTMAFNPSHLEAVNPVVEGIVQAKSVNHYQNNPREIVPVLIHGDAAVNGQGIVYELATLSKMKGYDNAGTVHVVLDNQVGFTANSSEGRTNVYSCEVAKLTDSPIFHVNGDDVEAVAHAFDVAMRLRQHFSIDVWINIICFRKRGHNETDDPSYTQPKMYEIIKNHPGLLSLYKEKLLQEKVIVDKECKKIEDDLRQKMETSLNKIKKSTPTLRINMLQDYWKGIAAESTKELENAVMTAVKRPLLDDLMRKLLKVPKDFSTHKGIGKIFEKREKLYFGEQKVNWAIAEQLAFATILHDEKSVRLAGQDSARGTFSHRHAILKDTKDEKKHCPLDSCIRGKANLTIINSQLSEYAILGFEYGYSMAAPHALVMWEAQFGDFANGAQIIIDQFISSSQTKWQRYSGITLLLPHGSEGMGPEHSSARLERFLQLCGENNMFVVNLTTPANFFHALRRQVVSSFRKPLIVMSPKSLLRVVISDISDLSDKNACFQTLIDDSTAVADKIKKVLMCSGKVYYELLQKREELKRSDVAIVRFEQLYPLDFPRWEKIKEKYNKATQWVWVQEEPANMGAWTHIHFYIKDMNVPLQLVSPKIAASPAKGSNKAHKQTQEAFINQAFK